MVHAKIREFEEYCKEKHKHIEELAKTHNVSRDKETERERERGGRGKRERERERERERSTVKRNISILKN